jgi:hypothetical protein
MAKSAGRSFGGGGPQHYAPCLAQIAANKFAGQTAARNQCIEDV